MRKKAASRTVIVATRDQVSGEVSGEVVILNLKNGIYYSLNDVGTYVWKLIQEPRTVADIVDRLLEVYDVEADRCQEDLQALLQKLAAEGLIDVTDDETG